MEPILKSEIFFFVTSISIIVFTVILIIFGFYLIKIMKNFSHISDELKRKVDDTISSLEEVGEDIRESQVYRFVFGSKNKSSKKKK